MQHTVIVCNDSEYFLRHRLPIALRLVELGYGVTVITGGKPIEQREISGWNYVNTHIERFGFSLAADLRLFLITARCVWKLRPRSVMLITLKPAVYSGLACVLARLVCGSPPRMLVLVPGLGRLMSPNADQNQHRFGLSKRLTSAAIRFISRRTGVNFAFETEHDRSYFEQIGLVSAKQSLVMRGAGVNPKIFFPDTSGITRQKLRFLFASRLIGAKGLHLFLGAAERLARRKDIEFIVAGMVEDHDPDRVDPKKLAKMKAITFVGEVAQMADLIRGCDVVCLPTGYGEGIPRILIEAAACGVPAIASDIPGCREIIADGINGAIVGGGNEDERLSSLCAAIAAYADDRALARTHGAAGYDRFTHGGFEEKKVIQQFVDLLA